MNLKDPLCQVDPNDRSLLHGCLLLCLVTQHHQRGTLRCRRVGASTQSDFDSCESPGVYGGWRFRVRESVKRCVWLPLGYAPKMKRRAVLAFGAGLLPAA